MSSGKAEDLIEKYQKGELTSKEAYEELKKRDLLEGNELWEFIPWSIYFLLLLLPTWAEHFKLDFLKWFAELPRFYFTTTIIYTSIVLVALAVIPVVWSHHTHVTKGGLRNAGDTLILYREGPYRVMRHPGVTGVMIWMTLLPIIVSPIVSFTYLSIAAIVMFNIRMLHALSGEEKLSIAANFGEIGRLFGMKTATCSGKSATPQRRRTKA